MCTTLLPCPLCSQPHFNSLESLRIGLIKVATENLVCPICKDTFMGLDKLTIHLFSHCEVQTETTETTENVRTASTDSNNPNKKLKYQKTQVNNEISTQEEPVNKVPVFSTLPFIGIPSNISDGNNHANQNGKALSEQCDMCGFYFLGKNILQMHKKLIHNVQEAEVKCLKHACHLCDKTFKMRGSLMVHLRMVHLENGTHSDKPTQEKVENFTIKPIDVKFPIKIDITEVNNNTTTTTTTTTSSASNKQWECDICHKMFTTKYFLKKHKRLHTGEMPYSCNQCHKTFTFQQSYHKHLLYHNDDKPHTCTHCGRSFKELSTLHNHQRIHTGEKPFSCESCGKCFRQRVSYLVHRRIHTGVMPYKCTACDKSFRYKVSQRTHKCTAQPPGTVVRQSGELVLKLIKNQTDVFSDPDVKNNQQLLDCQLSMTMDDKALDGKLDFSEATIKRDQTDGSTTKRKIEDEGKSIIDEILNDSIKKIDFDETIAEPYRKSSEVYAMNSPENLPSPSEKLKNLKLSSNHGSPTINSNADVCDGFSFLHEQFHKDGIIRHDYPVSSAIFHDGSVFGQIYP
ncbi:uncharacterized protein LOC143916328 [Arctopsyche grandis]|uniref:uncharacterized protein LOC143916328 n=1 Tax=Arctopsyche grandis TaxID=121162 RepID=UPI00406D8A43